MEAKKSHSKQDVENLIKHLNTFKESSLSNQEDRIANVSELASKLQNADAKNRAGDLIFKQESVTRRFASLFDSLAVKAVKMERNQPNGAHDVSNYCYILSLFCKGLQ